MNNYLVPINRYQFAQFYRYGYTYIPKSTLLEFDGHLSETTKENLASHFSVISPFEYDEEYLILHLSKIVDTSSENIYFEVQEIIAIYPLSKQAKLSIQEKIDQRIKLSEPFFESVLPIIESYIQKKEIEKAIDALWQICDIEGNKEELLNIIEIDNILKGLSYRQQGIKASKIPNGNYWSILIAYDRFDYFPNETIGYFYDAGQIFALTKNQPTFEGSGLHNFLNSLNKNLKTQQIVSAIDSSETTVSYRTQTTIGSLKKYIVAPLFLMLKDEIRSADDLYSTKLMKYINELKKYGNQFNASVILLGAFFGYKKFYDLYYDKLNLRIYKSYNPKQEVIPEQEIQLPSAKINEETKAEINLQKEVNIIDASTSNNKLEQSDIRKEIIERTNALSTKLLEEPILDNSLPVIEISQPNNNIEAHETCEKIKVDEEQKVEKEPAMNEKFNDLKFIILEIIQSKGEMTVTNLGKALHLRTSTKMKNEIIENILKDIPEVELFKEKSSKKVRPKSLGLFKA